MQGGGHRRGRRAQRTTEEVRSEMLAAALELLEERGLTVRIDSARFEDMAAASGVSRSTAYRAWNDPDSGLSTEVRFHDAVVTDLIGGRTGNDALGVLDATLAMVAEQDLPEDPTALSLEERRRLLRQMIRTVTAETFRISATNRLWLAYVAVGSLVAASDDELGPLDKAALDRWESTTHEYAELYSGMATLFGLEPRAGYDADLLDLLSSCVLEGLVVQEKVLGELPEPDRATGPAGEIETWTLYSVAFEAFCQHVFAPAAGCARPVDLPPDDDRIEPAIVELGRLAADGLPDDDLGRAVDEVLSTFGRWRLQ